MGRYLNIQINKKFIGEKSLKEINRDLFENYGSPVQELFNSKANLQKYADYLNDDAEGKNEFPYLERPVTAQMLIGSAVWFKIGFVQVKLSGGIDGDAVKCALALAYWAAENSEKIDLANSSNYDLETIFIYGQDSLPRFRDFLSTGQFIISESIRRQLAKDAFWGKTEDLADKIKDLLSYEMDGKSFPANGFTLADAQKAVSEMKPEELLPFVEKPNYVIAQGETELLSGDENSVGMIFNNLTGSNLIKDGFQEFIGYLNWAKKELSFSALMPQKLSIVIK